MLLYASLLANSNAISFPSYEEFIVPIIDIEKLFRIFSFPNTNSTSGQSDKLYKFLGKNLESFEINFIFLLIFIVYDSEKNKLLEY